MPDILAPIGLNVEINCTAAVGTAYPPFWAIDLAADSSTTALQFANRKGRLNAHGIYELPPIETPLTLRLLINDTAINITKQIFCDRGAQYITTYTVLYVFSEFSKSLIIMQLWLILINNYYPTY